MLSRLLQVGPKPSPQASQLQRGWSCVGWKQVPSCPTSRRKQALLSRGKSSQHSHPEEQR